MKTCRAPPPLYLYDISTLFITASLKPLPSAKFTPNIRAFSVSQKGDPKISFFVVSEILCKMKT